MGCHARGWIGESLIKRKRQEVSASRAARELSESRLDLTFSSSILLIMYISIAPRTHRCSRLYKAMERAHLRLRRNLARTSPCRTPRHLHPRTNDRFERSEHTRSLGLGAAIANCVESNATRLSLSATGAHHSG